MPKRGVAKPPLLDPKPTIGRTAFWPLSRNPGSGIGSQGSFQSGLGFGDLSFGNPRFGSPDPNRRRIPGTEVGEPGDRLWKDPGKDPIRKPDSEVALGTPIGRGPKEGVELNAGFH